jgi:hypothetical protein
MTSIVIGLTGFRNNLSFYTVATADWLIQHISHLTSLGLFLHHSFPIILMFKTRTMTPDTGFLCFTRGGIQLSTYAASTFGYT